MDGMGLLSGTPNSMVSWSVHRPLKGKHGRDTTATPWCLCWVGHAGLLENDWQGGPYMFFSQQWWIYDAISFESFQFTCVFVVESFKISHRKWFSKIWSGQPMKGPQKKNNTKKSSIPPLRSLKHAKWFAVGYRKYGICIIYIYISTVGGGFK